MNYELDNYHLTLVIMLQKWCLALLNLRVTALNENLFKIAMK